MRIVLFSKEAQLDGIAHHVPSEKFLRSVSAEEVQAFCKVDELTYLLIDIDDAEGDGHKLNRLTASFSHVKRIIFSGHYSPKDFKKHQFSEESADGYLKKPIETSDFLDLIRDFSFFYKEDLVEETTNQEGHKGIESEKRVLWLLKK